MTKRSARLPRSAAAAAAAIVSLSAAAPALASLGSSTASVSADRVRFQAKVQSSYRAGFSAHDLTSSNGTVVREYVNSADVVFAVSWRGPARPDLSQLLGPKFEVLQADNAPVPGLRRRRPLRVDRADFVLRSGGHPGAMWGRAVLPSETPSTFTQADFK